MQQEQKSIQQKTKEAPSHTPHDPITLPVKNIVVKTWQHETIYATAKTGTYMFDKPLKQVMTDDKPVILNPLTENAIYLVETEEFPPMAMFFNGQIDDGSLWFVSH